MYFRYYNERDKDKYIKLFKDVMIVDSLSKSHGLAGLRSGIVIAEKEIINILRKHKPMQEVCSITVNESIKTLNSKIDIKNIKHCNRWKSIFNKKFKNNYIYTWTNFILLKDYSNYYDKLYENKILTRNEFDHQCMDGILRITIGTNKIMRKVLKILKDKK